MPTEKTFTGYNPSQANTYSQSRLNYHPTVYNAILTHHTSTGGALTTLLDVGCGPGLATFSLAPYFSQAIGLDPSQGMITTAQSLNQDSGTNVVFQVSTAEDLGSGLDPPIANGSVDLITAANAAHWFDMPAFWKSAARVLKPGGTVALWTSGGVQIHPSVPNAVAIQAALDEIEEREVVPFYEQGNVLVRAGYDGLPLPWGEDGDSQGAGDMEGGFERESFVKKKWGVTEEFHANSGVGVDLDTFEKMMGTGSPVTRWREAHPELVGTEGDVVRLMRREIERLLREAGVPKGEERMRGAAPGVLLMVKRR